MTTKDRLKEYLSYKKIGRNRFESKIGVATGYMSSKGMTITSDVIEKACTEFPELNIEWLITGKGSMLKEESSGSLPQAAINYERKGAPYYNVDFNGGFDIVYNDQTQHPDYYIDYQPYNKEGVVWCNITGHSMEPLITHGDTIAMKEVESWQTFLLLDEIYGIVTDEFRTVKQVSKSERPDFLKLIPVNSNGYQPQDIPIKIIKKVFKVLGSVKKF